MILESNFARRLRRNLRSSNAVRKYLIAPKERRSINAMQSPQRLIIEPINICNFACPKCLYPSMERPKTSLDTAAFHRFLHVWKERFGEFESVEFTGAGEVLVLNSFEDIVSVATATMPDCLLTTTTNLYLLDPERAAALVSRGLRKWQVSLDTVDAREYQSVTGSNSDIRITLYNLQTLFAELNRVPDKRNELIVVVHYFPEREREAMVREIMERVSPICHRVQAAPYNTLNGRIANGRYSASERKSYTSKIPVPCDYLWKDLVVVSNGDVRICCVDMFDRCIDLGNIFTDTPDQIIDNRNRRFLQKAIYNCDYGCIPFCGRCHAPFY